MIKYNNNRILIKFPGKKNLLFFVLAVTIVGVIFWYTKKQTPLSYNTKTATDTLSVIAEPDYSDKDSDADGLKDWEELLYNMDPNNPDTNGNGISDKEEVEQRGGVSSLTTVSGSSENKTVSNKDINKTDEIGFSLVNQLLALQQNGTLNSDSLSDLSNSLINNLFTESDTKTYLQQDIKTASSNTSQEILDYANSFLVLFKNISLVIEGVPTNIKNFNNFSDPTFEPQIKKIASAYDNFALSLLKLSVPKEIASLHLSIINNQVRMAFYLSKIANMGSDPLGALVFISKFEETFSQQSTLFQNLENYLKSRGIILPNSQSSFILKTQ